MAELFDFDKREITNYIEYNLETFKKFKEPFNYVINTLKALGHSYVLETLDNIDANKIVERKGKSYHYSVIEYKTATIVIRRYGSHLTIYTKATTQNEYNRTEYGCFTFEVDFKKFGDKQDEMSDKWYDKPFTGLNEILPGLFKLLLEKSVHWVWNSYSLKRPDYVDIKLVFRSNEITSLDNFIFCMEELSSIYSELFAETTMLTKIKQMTNKVGEMLNGRYKIESITTDVKDSYFHAVGISLIDTMGTEGKSFQDVYSLTRWYIEDIFKEDFFLYKGDVYILGGEFIEGEPIVYKELNGVTVYKKGILEQNFLPLIKFN
jgi:hypothetical protein